MKELDPVAAEPRSPDESGEASATQPDARVAQRREHDTDASGLAVDDPARGEQRKKLYRDGMTEVSELD